MTPRYSPDRQFVFLETQRGMMTVPVARWPAAARDLGLGEESEDGFVPVTPQDAPASFQPLTRAQMRLALLGGAITGTQVSAAIDAIADATARETARILWEDSQSFHREHPLIAQLGQAFNLTAAEIDALWRQAEGL